MKHARPLAVLAGLALLAPAARLSAQTPAAPTLPVLRLDLRAQGAKVSPTLYGLMTEEINHSYDGGLYAELVQNRSFRDNEKTPVHWSPVASGDSAVTLALDTANPLGAAQPVSLRLDVSAASAAHPAGVANDGYWGIPVRPATTYRASFYARTAPGFSGPVTVALESDDGSTIYAKAEVSGLGADWANHSVTLTTGAGVPTTTGRLVITVAHPGTLWLDLVSLFPPTYNDRPNGSRIDIMRMLADMNPAFLRFPGGNYLEGDTIATRFPWKQTLGPLVDRPGHMGCWRYRSSDGFGLLEFLDWCEDLHMKLVLAVYAGYSLKGQHVNPGPDLQPYVQDALDEIEYVTGGPETKWGAQRVKDGHPAPFSISYIEIGNEDGFDKSGTYEARFTQFFDAIKKKYPDLKLISTVGGEDPLGRRFKVKQRTPDALDEHYYRNAGEMEADANHYDHYDRNGPKIFVGEWATREGSPTTNLNAALGDAAWMTGMERNSDVVVLASYAPLFVHVGKGAMQWRSDLIGYDALSSYGSPSYYAQKMFNTHLGDRVVPIAASGIPTQAFQPAPSHKNDKPPAPIQIPALFYVATRDTAKGVIYLKVVNAGAAPQTVRIQLKGASTVAPEGKSVVLSSARPTDTNTIDHPDAIVPVTTKIDGLGTDFTRTFAPYSVNVLQIEAR